MSGEAGNQDATATRRDFHGLTWRALVATACWFSRGRRRAGRPRPLATPELRRLIIGNPLFDRLLDRFHRGEPADRPKTTESSCQRGRQPICRIPAPHSSSNSISTPPSRSSRRSAIREWVPDHELQDLWDQAAGMPDEWNPSRPAPGCGRLTGATAAS